MLLYRIMKNIYKYEEYIIYMKNIKLPSGSTNYNNSSVIFAGMAFFFKFKKKMA